MKLATLTEEQITALYRDRMERDFPPAELKPLDRILDARRNGQYECLGAEEDGVLLGYAFFAGQDPCFLLDYLAVTGERRNAGIGSAMLALLRPRFAGGACVLAEAEDPDFAEREEDRLLRERRLRFYFRNGCRDTAVRAEVYGVPYRILALNDDNGCDAEEIRRRYCGLYRQILPGRLYEQHVIIRGQDAETPSGNAETNDRIP